MNKTTNLPEDTNRFKPKLNKPLYKFGQFLARVYVSWGFRCDTEGFENLPTEGPVLIVANHQSFLDPPAIGYRVKRYLTFLARASLFDIPVAGKLLQALNTIPLRDEQGDVRAIRAVIDRLKRGEAVVMFPEGARTFDGQPTQFREGAAIIINRAKCPVIPVAIEGAFDAWPRQASQPRFFKGHRIAVNFGKPIPHDEIGPAKEVATRLQQEIETLRLRARDRLRAKTNGARPLPGPGDHRFIPPSQQHQPADPSTATQAL